MFGSRAAPIIKFIEASSRFSIFKGFDTSQLCCGVVHYARIAHLVPPVSPEALSLIEKIVVIVLDWEEELFRKYPLVLLHGRPIRSLSDTLFVTSLETYLKGELATYSPKTLKLYYEHLVKEQSERINGSEITLLQTIKQYDFSSLEEANAKLKSGA